MSFRYALSVTDPIFGPTPKNCLSSEAELGTLMRSYMLVDKDVSRQPQTFLGELTKSAASNVRYCGRSSISSAYR
jgi:hypothetical protein